MAVELNSTKIIDILFESLRAQVDAMTPEEQLQFTEKVLSLPQTPVGESPASPGSSDDIVNAFETVRVDKKVPKRRAPRKTTVPRAKKPVNAFMTFRAYLAPILGDMPQKFRSPMLSMMWQAEQRKGQFHLLGASWSKMRDECTDCPSLDKFLQVATNAVSVLPAEDYLQLSGWVIADINGVKTVRPFPTNNDAVIAMYPLQTNASTYDIIKFCFDRGLINSMPSGNLITAPRHPEMSFAALPQNHDLELSVMQVQNDIQTANNSATPFDFNDLSSLFNPNFSAITQDQQQNYNNTPAIAHWLPQVQPPVLGLDIDSIQDEFYPFSFDFDAHN